MELRGPVRRENPNGKGDKAVRAQRPVYPRPDPGKRKLSPSHPGSMPDNAALTICLPMHVHSALGAGGLPRGIRRTAGAALVLDVRGFTALSEACARRAGRAGGELVAAALNEFFEPLVGLAADHDASITHFAGDAMVLVLPERTGEPAAAGRAASLGRSMLAAVAGHRGVLVGRRRLRLEARAGTGDGGYAWFVCDDRHGRRIAVTGGPALGAAVAAQRVARTGRLVSGTGSAGRIGRPAPRSRPATVPAAVARRFVPPTVAQRLAAGQRLLLSEHRQVAMVVCDLAGGIEELRPVIGAIAAAAGDVEGLLLPVDPTEDGARLLVALGAPLAHEDDVSRGLHLARVCAAAGGAVGVEVGRCYCGLVGGTARADYSVIGDAVNVAARLAAAAAPGDALAGSGVHAAHPAVPGWGRSRRLRLKGRSSTVAARAIPAEGAVGHPEDDLAPMAGRSAERARLRRAIADATAGRGRALVMTGPAGIGKSRLTAEARRMARRRGMRAITVPFDVTGAADWAPLVHELGGRTADELGARLAKVDPELAGLAPLLAELARIDAAPTPAVAALDDERRLRTQGALLVALMRSAGRERPLLLVLDDLHRASDAARRLAADLAAAVSGSPLLVVAAAREVPAGSLAAAEIPLRPLRGDDADALTGIALRAAVGEDAVPAADLRKWLTRRAAGNPLVAHELARLLRDRRIDLSTGEPPAGLPQGVEQLVLARFDGLPPAVQSAIRVASVVGGTFDAATLRSSYPRLGRGTDRTLDRAVALDILDRRGPGFGFRHGLVAEVVYASMAASARRSIHAAAARHLVAEGPDEHLDAIADHYARTELSAEQRRWLGRAADAAAARHDHDAAARHLGGLVPVLRAGPRRGALARLAASERVTGRWDDAASHLRAALAGSAGEERLVLACGLGDLLSYRGDWDEALDLLDAACTGFAAAGDEAREAWALGLLAYAAFRRSAHRRAEAAARRELELAARLGDAHLAADATHKLAQVAWHVRGAAAAAPLGRRSLAAMRSTGDLVGTLEVANDLAGIELELGQPDRAARRLALAARTARRIGDRAAARDRRRQRRRALPRRRRPGHRRRPLRPPAAAGERPWRCNPHPRRARPRGLPGCPRRPRRGRPAAAGRGGLAGPRG